MAKGLKLGEPASPHKNGYSFDGWYKEREGINAWVFNRDEVDSNMTLFAKWVADSYIITYNANGATGGSVPAAQTKTHGIDLAVSANTGSLVHTGYTFAGWNTKSDGTGTDYAAGYAYSINATATLYAKWTADTYSVTYNGNGATSGIVPTQQTKYHGVDLIVVANTGNLVRTGYTFAGWNTQANGSGTDYAAGALYTGNAAATLYAKWTADTYSVTYNANGATGGTVPSNQVKIHDVGLTLATNSGGLVRTGYTFVGWNTLANGNGTDYAAGSSFTSNADTTFYAKWTADTYAIVYNANGATGGAVPTAQTKTHGIDLTVSANTGSLVRTGYIFSGWNTQANGSGTDYPVGSSLTINASTTLYAKWTADTYSVTYDDNGATGGTVPADQEKIHDVGLILATNNGELIRTGYTFRGWNTQANGSGTDYAVGSSLTTNANTTLYAKWTANTYTVAFEPYGGTPAPTDMMVIYNQMYGSLPTVERTGYSFDGWYTEANGTGARIESATTVFATSNNTLYAKWTPNMYSVTYNTDGATSGSAPASQTKIHGIDLTVSANTGHLARNGYTFSGWNTQADGSGTDYAIGSLLTTNTNTNLYAKWTIRTYTVNYNANGATDGAVPTAQTKTYGVDLILSENTGSLVRTGYTFGGWNPRVDGKGFDYATGTTYSVDASITLYAKWIADTYPVTYDANGATGGTVPADQVKIHDVGLSLATNSGGLVRTGYTFVGWNTRPDGSGTDYVPETTYTYDSTLTLYAKWAANIYTVTFEAYEGTPAPVDMAVTYNQTYGTLPTVTRTGGYTFGGWWTLEGGTGTHITENSLLLEASDHTLYAKWIFNVFTGPAGGLVFYENPNYSIDGWRYLEAAPEGWSGTGRDPGYVFGYYRRADGSITTVGTETGIGSGKPNTEALVLAMGSSALVYSGGNKTTDQYAAKICADFSITVEEEVYDDWFLPSRDELNLMYLNLQRNGLGGFYGLYNAWSSSEYSSSLPWSLSFEYGVQQTRDDRDNQFWVRPVRAF